MLFFTPDNDFNFIVLQRCHRQDFDGSDLSWIRTIYVRADDAKQAVEEAESLYCQSFRWEHLGVYRAVAITDGICEEGVLYP